MIDNLRISANKDDIGEILRRIAECNCDLDKIERWIRDNVVEI